jgi:hypothetical protein
MPIVTPAIQTYFDSLYSRIHTAAQISFREVTSEEWQPKQSDCYHNADRWVGGNNARQRIRGWLTWGIDGLGSCMFVAHSVIGEAGTLYDITPIDANTPSPRFLGHEGTAEIFDAMQPEWSWTIYPFITQLSNEPAEFVDQTTQS